MNLSEFSKICDRFRLLVRHLGLINGSLYLFNRLAEVMHIGAFFNKYYFVVQPLSPTPALPEGKGKLFRVVELPAQQVGELQGLRPDAVFADRYNQGAVCLAVYKSDEFAGCLWYIKLRYREDEVLCIYDLISDKSVWDFDVYIEPKYRFSPAFLKLWDEASARLITEGNENSISRISAFNPSSLSSHTRLGAKILGWAVFFRIAFLQITLASISPYFHISLSDKSLPIFKL